jgi:hypothetical protein
MMEPTPKRTRRVTPFVALGLVASLARAAAATDPRVGFREPASVKDGLTVSQRLDAGGANYSRVLLPKAPSIGFQVRLAPPIIGEATADGEGGVLVAHGRDRVSALDATGRSLWSVRLNAELASSPIPFGSGGYLLVARDGRLFELTSSGSVSERPALPWNDLDTKVLYTPTSEGGAIVANGSRLARIGPEGARGFQTRLKSVIRAVFDWRGATLAVGSDGSLWARGMAGEARELASFAAPVSQALLLDDRVLGLAQHELLSLELATGRTSVVWAEPTLELRDFASAGGRQLRVLAGRALLVELDLAGRELGRFALGSGETSPELASLVSDPTGASYVVAVGAPLAFVTPEGDFASIAGTGCPDPLPLTPVARNRLVAACRSGLVRGLSDKAR